MKTKNRVQGIEFVRKLHSEHTSHEHQIIIHIEKEIPPLGYGTKEIIKLLKKYYNNK